MARKVVKTAPPPRACQLPDYVPTPAQIAAECESIRAEWTPQERGRRGRKCRGSVDGGDAKRARIWVEVEE